MKTLTAVAGALFVTHAAAAELPEIKEVRAHFSKHLEHMEFAVIEDRHAALSRQRSRTREGWFLADAYVHANDFTKCLGNIGAPIISGSTPLTVGHCENRFLLGQWRVAFPQSALPRITQANYLLVRAQFRDTQAAQRNALLDEAWQALHEVSRERRIPGWYVAAFQVAVAKGLAEREFQLLLEEGLAAFADRPAIYRAAAHYHFPRNGGSLADLEAFARRASGAEAPERRALYAQIYDEAYEYGRIDFMYRQSRVSWPAMREGLEATYKLFPAPYNRNRLGQHACVAGDLRTLVRVLAEMRDTDRSGWYAGEEERCRRLAAQAQPPTGARIQSLRMGHEAVKSG
jgi:hypothetical protein